MLKKATVVVARAVLDLKARGLLVLVLILPVFLQADEPWSVDWKESQVRAREEKKDLLVYFTGSDWSVWCKRLDRDVLSKEDFLTFTKEHFVLVQLDFPDKKTLPDEEKNQNKKLLKKYFVKSFPTIFLLDDSGRPFGVFSFEREKATFFIKKIERFIARKEKRDLLLSEAGKLKGPAKAHKLLSAFDALNNEEFLIHYKNLQKEILQLDESDETGFKKRQELKVALAKLEGDVLSLVRKEEKQEALVRIDAFVLDNKLAGAFKQNALFLKLIYYPIIPENFDKVDELMDEILLIKSDSVTSLKCQKIKKNIVRLRLQFPAEDKKE